MAAATVRVPPMTAQTPVRKPEKVLVRSSRLMTFMGEMSCIIEKKRERVSFGKGGIRKRGFGGEE